MARPKGNTVPDLKAAQSALKEASIEIMDSMLANPPRSGDEMEVYVDIMHQLRIARKSHDIVEEELDKFRSNNPAVRETSRFVNMKEILAANSNVREWVALYSQIVQRKKEMELGMSRVEILQRAADRVKD